MPEHKTSSNDTYYVHVIGPARIKLYHDHGSNGMHTKSLHYPMRDYSRERGRCKKRPGWIYASRTSSLIDSTCARRKLIDIINMQE